MNHRGLITVLLTAAMRSTSLRLLRMKQASASSILFQCNKQQQQQQQRSGHSGCMKTRLSIDWLDRRTILECICALVVCMHTISTDGRVQKCKMSAWGSVMVPGAGSRQLISSSLLLCQIHGEYMLGS